MMLEIVTPVLYLLAGISFCAGLQHLWAGMSTRANRNQLILAAACALWAFGVIFLVQTYHAADEAAYRFALRPNIDLVVVATTVLAVFIARITRFASVRALAIALLPLPLAVIAANHLLPYTVQFETLDGIEIVTLPWGEAITAGRGRAGAAAYATTVLLVSLIGFSCYALLRDYRRTKDRAALWMLAGFGVLIATTCEGTLVRLSFVDFVSLGPVGFTVLIVIVGAAATRESTRRLQASEAKYHALFADSPQALLAIDPVAGRILAANATALRTLGYSEQEILGRSIADLTCPEDQEDSRRRLEQLASGSMPGLRYDRWCLTKDGQRILVDCSVSVSKGAEGEADRLIFSANDITQRRRMEQALQSSEARVRSIIEQSPIPISCSRDGTTLEVNEAYARLYGYRSAAELTGQPALLRFAPQCREEIHERIRKRARGEPMETAYESVGLRKDGSQFPILVYAKRIELADGPATFAFIIDMSERRAAQERIRHLASFDQLTGLANRQYLGDRLQRVLAASARQSRYAALLQLDLDKFKTINETLGPAEGDNLLKEVAARLSSVVRNWDTVARMGADKFAILLEDLSELQAQAIAQAEGMGEKILREIGRRFELQGQPVRCTCSIGLTLFRDPLLSPEDVIKQADIAMYEAKDQGRNTLRFFDPRMQEIIDAKVSLETDLHKALEEGQFELHYQIQVDRTFLPIGAEALIRWQHPTRGSVSPGQFIPLAEETDLIVPIGRWVLESACAQLRAWREQPMTRDLTLAVNVSAREFRTPGFVDEVREAIGRHGVNPGKLKLELTESILVENVDDTVATMRALKEIGVRFSLDDFGTGYSSLQYLKRLPLDQLKIDQSFVRDIASDPGDYAIVRTVIAMARSMGVDVIAEGVETKRQREMLLKSGCQQFQGYLFGKPVPASQFVDFVVASLIGHQDESWGRTPGLRARR